MILIISLLLLSACLYCRHLWPALSSFGNSVVKDKRIIDLSYILLAPFCTLEGLREKGNVYLLDLYGKKIHSWKICCQPFAVHLKKDGNLVVSATFPEKLNKYPSGKTDIIQELDWEGKIVWEYKNSSMHHDFEILPSGNIAAIIYDKVPEEIARKIKGGILNFESEDNIWADAIIEIDRESKKIIWIWHAFDHLDPKKHPLNEQSSRSEWTHSNSIRYTPKSPIDGEAAYLISMRHINTVLLVRRRDGMIIWESPKDMLAYQHDATLLDNGNILVFDNGLFRKQERPSLWSRVIEINPKKNKIVWQFDGGKTRTEKNRFSASVLGSAQRLQNGNTLIANGLQGHLFEVTPRGKIVWDFINPCIAHATGPWPNNIMFKVRRYRPEEINWPSVISKPLPILSTFIGRLNG